MPSYELLPQDDEDNLHAKRLLTFEEKPFKRVTRRLLSTESPLFTPLTPPATPPTDASTANEVAAAHEVQLKHQEDPPKQFHEEVLLDSAAFESSIVYVQFQLNANERERERYAAEKLRIDDTARAARDSIAQLREQLKEAQINLEIRKDYDDLADTIFSNKAMKPRDEQHGLIEKLHAEIAELENEQADYSRTWVERREQFDRILEQGVQMMRLIRDEKEEAERKEDMDDLDDDTETSKTGTPRPLPDGATPQHPAPDAESGSGFQRVAEHALGVTAPFEKRSRAASTATEQEESISGDAAMADAGDSGEREIRDEQAEEEAEEGEEMEEPDESAEKMDTT